MASGEWTNFGKTKFTLNNGIQMPAVGMGTYRVRNSEDIFSLVDTALEAGYRLFDTASVYGNEVLLGQALRTLLPKYGLEREDVFITSKLVLRNTAPGDHGTMTVKRAFNKSLDNLGLDYMDMYLVHFPGGTKVNHHQGFKNSELRAESWRAMEYLYDDGKINAIGVCNYTVAHLSEFLYAYSNIPVVNQVEFHPFYNQTELLNFCRCNCIVMQAYCSFGGTSTGQKELMNNPVVQNIASHHETTPAQVLLLWALQQDVAVIPKSVTPSHIKKNIKLDFRLTSAEMKALSSLETTKKYAWDPSCVE